MSICRKIQNPKVERNELKTDNAIETECAHSAEIDMEWLGLRQLTSYAPVSERTLRSWIHSPVNPLPAARVKGEIYVRRVVFDNWLERHSVKSERTVEQAEKSREKRIEKQRSPNSAVRV